MFYPWSTDLKSYFIQNIKDFSTSVAKYKTNKERVIIFIATEPTVGKFIELKNIDGTCVSDTLFTYNSDTFTSEESLATIFNKIKSISPTEKYSMIVGGHGVAWIPIQSKSGKSRVGDIMHYDMTGGPLTRYFGGKTSEYQIEISTFAQSLQDADMTLEYMLFDDCYMSSIEAAYELKDVTHYLIACPTEIMAYGFPYQTCGRYLIGTPDYSAICNEFYNFYSSYGYPYGTIAVTDCTELDAMAEIVKEINLYGSTNQVDVDDIQRLDGYTPPIFYDFDDVIKHKCTDNDLYNKFLMQLNVLVPHKAHTKMYYTSLLGTAIKINTYSGLNTSDFSTNSHASTLSDTKWYKATH
jgi:hypothetical protein